VIGRLRERERGGQEEGRRVEGGRGNPSSRSSPDKGGKFA